MSFKASNKPQTISRNKPSERSNLILMEEPNEPKSETSPKSMYFNQYISHEGSIRLHHYQYHGSDHSLIYKHILTPWNNFLMQFMPLWIAPNVITLSGLILVSITHCLLIYYCPALQGHIPNWLYLCCAVALFGYQTLDNLDGKQARRTKTSSPLGLLFDHGCDAINVTVGCCTLACIVQFGPTWKSLLLFLTGNLVFISATWEEYYTGKLELPIVNGPTEGILVAVFLKLFTIFVGKSFWHQEFIAGVYNHSLVLAITTVCCVLTVSSNVMNVCQAIRGKRALLIAFTRLLPFLLVNGLATVWALHSPDGIFQQCPRLFLWTLGMLNSKLVLHLMVAHLCDEEYRPFRKTLVPIFYVAIHWAFCSYQGLIAEFNEKVVLNEFFFLTLVAYLHMTICVILEVSQVLSIPIFTIPSCPAHAKRA